MIEIVLADEGRRDTSVAIDGQDLEVPASGALRQTVPHGTRQVTLRRRGYEQIDVALVVRDGETIEYQPGWQPLSLPSIGAAGSGLPAFGGGDSGVASMQLTFDDWLQDFELAKQQAAAKNRDVLILFDGSDWCGYSMQMADRVFYTDRFQQQIANQHVLLYIDFPRTAGGKAKVEDADRNARLAEQFRVEGFPTIVVTDRDGLPFGRMGYVEGGFEGFAEHLGALQRIRDQRNSLLAQVQVGDGKAKLESARHALSLVQSLGFESFYVSLFREWYDASKQSDPQNHAGDQEVFFEAWWQASLSEIDQQDETALAARAGDIDAWAERHDFVDPELAGRLYLQAAWLSREQPELIKKYAVKGLSFGPRDERVLGLLTLLKQAAADLNILGTGSGFIVSRSGHVLTNQHVAHGPGRLVVHLPGVAVPVSATVAAEDRQLDLALLTVEFPEGIEPVPLRLSGQSPSRGAAVAAFGFPLGEQVGKGLKLTTGVVSATAEQTDNGMILLDCRINPGNSGGPLCNPRGEVIGVVTARSLASAEVDSYGMAVPGSSVRDFLERVLPGFDADQTPPPVVADSQWDTVDQAVSSSVLMIQRLR